MAPSSQMEVASSTSGMALASSALRTANALGSLMSAVLTLTSSPQDLSNSQLDALKDIFGDAAGGGAYSGQQVGRLEGGTNGVEAIIQVV